MKTEKIPGLAAGDFLLQKSGGFSTPATKIYVSFAPEGTRKYGFYCVETKIRHIRAAVGCEYTLENYTARFALQ